MSINVLYSIKSRKKVYIALKDIYGIGLSRGKLVCQRLGLNLTRTYDSLKDSELKRIVTLINRSYKVDQELQNWRQLRRKALINVKSYRGLRHMYGLPVRGQRTHSNGRTAKRFAVRK